MTLPTRTGKPGMAARIDSVEGMPIKGVFLHQDFHPSGIIASTAIDATNTPTTILSPGLVLARLDANQNEFVEYDQSQTDGRQNAVAILYAGHDTLNNVSAVTDKPSIVLTGGRLKASDLVGLDGNARAQLSAGGRFTFDDELQPWVGSGLPKTKYLSGAGPATLTSADNNSEIHVTASGAFTLNLPALATSDGFRCRLISHDANDLVITSAETGNILTEGNAAADTVTVSDIGDVVEVWCAADGSEWVVATLVGTAVVA